MLKPVMSNRGSNRYMRRHGKNYGHKNVELKQFRANTESKIFQTKKVGRR